MQTRIKLLHIIHGFYIGGAETLVKDYCLNIDKNTFDLTVLCINNFDTAWDKLLKQNNIKVIYLAPLIFPNGRKKDSLFTKIYFHLSLYRLFRKYIRQIQPDIIHSHLNMLNYIRFANPPKTTRMFHTIHSEVNRLFFNNSDSWRYRKDCSYLIKHYDMRLIALHERMKNEANELFKVSNTLVFNNGIDVKKYQDAGISKADERNQLGIPETAFVLGHVGRFVDIKNHSFLVDIFERVYKQNDNAFLLMIGGGPEIENIKKKLAHLNLSEHSLILTDRNDINEILQTMDYFVFPSQLEGLGIALVEAQCAGIPCIVSDTVPQAATVSNLVLPLSLDSSAEHWAQELLAFKVAKAEYDGLENWDILKIIKRLENLYTEEVQSI